MELILHVKGSFIHVVVTLLIFPLEKSICLVTFVVFSLKLVILCLFLAEALELVLLEVTLVCYILPLVFALTVSIVVMEMALIDHSVWHYKRSLSFSFSLIEVPNVQRPI